MNLKVILAFVVGFFLVVTGVFLLWNQISRGTQVVVSVDDQGDSGPRAALRRFERPDGSVLEVFGPCFEGSRATNTVFAGSAANGGDHDCFDFLQGGRDFVDLRGSSTDAFFRFHHSTGTLSLASSTRNVIEVRGNVELLIRDGGVNRNVLVLPNLDAPDVRFVLDGEDMVVRTPASTIVLAGQMRGNAQEGTVSHIVLRDSVFDQARFVLQAFGATGTPGNDDITTTDGDDVIFPGGGNDRITLRGGRNSIHYESGNDTIRSVGVPGAFNELFLPFARQQVQIQISPSLDVFLVTPSGRLTLQLQAFHPVGSDLTVIHRLHFADGFLDDAEIREAAVAQN